MVGFVRRGTPDGTRRDIAAKLDPARLGEHTPGVANERFSSGLIDEGGDRSTRLPPLPRLLVAAVVLFVAGAAIVWLFTYVIANL